MKSLCQSFLFLAVLFNLSGCSDLCENTIDYTVYSKDGNHIAYVFERNCGATTGFSTQISVLNSQKKLKNNDGNLFIADNGVANVSDIGTIATEVIWKDNNHIIVRYDGKAKVFKKVKNLQGIKIQYETF